PGHERGDPDRGIQAHVRTLMDVGSKSTFVGLRPAVTSLPPNRATPYLARLASRAKWVFPRPRGKTQRQPRHDLQLRPKCHSCRCAHLLHAPPATALRAQSAKLRGSRPSTCWTPSDRYSERCVRITVNRSRRASASARGTPNSTNSATCSSGSSATYSTTLPVAAESSAAMSAMVSSRGPDKAYVCPLCRSSSSASVTTSPTSSVSIHGSAPVPAGSLSRPAST